MAGLGDRGKKVYFIIMALTLERNEFHLQFETKKSKKVSMIITSMIVT